MTSEMFVILYLIISHFILITVQFWYVTIEKEFEFRIQLQYLLFVKDEALSRVSNADNIVLYLTDRQLISNPFLDRIEPYVLNIVYSDALNNV
jgi:hypothetical protein